MFRNPWEGPVGVPLVLWASDATFSGASKGVVSFLGVWKSRVMAEDVSLPIVARGVVASLEEAEMIEGGANGSAGGTAAIGVLCREDSRCSLSAANMIGEGRLGVEGFEFFSRAKREEGPTAPGLLEGTVLLRCTLPPGVMGVPAIGVTGVGPASDLLLCLLETETFLRKLFHLLSALLLALELDRLTTVLDLLGVTGEPGTLVGLGTPDCTSLTVS